jgi:hypothetical protein
MLGLLIFFILLYIVKFKYWLSNRKTASLYKSNSLITYGYKGAGKDTIYQLVIIIRFKRLFKKQIKALYRLYGKTYEVDRVMNKQYLEYLELHKYEDNFERYLRFIDKYPANYLSNVDYGYGAKIVHMNLFSLYPNTYKDLIENAVKIVQKNPEFEGLDYYISDGGAILPSHEDTFLNKQFPSFPLLYAFSRQLYYMLIQINTQDIDRIWKKLREQQDGYVRALQTVPKTKSFMQKLWPYIPYFKKYLFVKYRFYRNYDSAKSGKLPFSKVGLLSKNNALYSTTPAMMKEMYVSEFGEIIERTIVLKISDIKFDSREFHKTFFGYRFVPDKKVKTKRSNPFKWIINNYTIFKRKRARFKQSK